MTTRGAITIRRLRAPRHPGEALIAPPLAQAAAVIEENRRLAERHESVCHGVPLRELAGLARRELRQAAWEYTSRYADLGAAPAEQDNGPLILSGHQPQLFHAGVWFKNFVLSSIGQQHAARSINLIIDNDVCPPPVIRVPTGPAEDPRIRPIPFDASELPIPYEERRILDQEIFSGFPRAVRSALDSLVEYTGDQGRPIVDCLWPEVMQAASGEDNLGRVLARARHVLERRWGLTNWEVPLGELCRGSAFRRFSLHLLTSADKLRSIYNDCLQQYRRANRVRSRAHPVPALSVEGSWIEAPFWIWNTRRPRRRALYVRKAGVDQLELSDRNGWSRLVRVSVDGDVSEALGQWESWEQQGTKVRPRALTTTMFARLLLCDLFVHGIGGAKYDELTDAILERFFHVTAPRFLISTATFWLPVPRPAEGVDQQLRETQRHLRALRYHPEDYLEFPDGDASRSAQAWMENKRRWIEASPPSGQRKARHLAIEESNLALQPHVEPQRREFLRMRQQLQREARRRRLLASREFSYCLFPEKSLRRTLLELSREEP